MYSRTLDTAAIKDIVQDIFDAAKADKIELPSTMVVVGGASMALNGLRMSSDIDLFVSSQPELEALVEKHIGTWRKKYGEEFSVDLTTSDYAFSESIRVADIQATRSMGFAKDAESGDVYGYGILDTETLFIAKCCSGREKDAQDLGLILNHSSPEKILERLNTMITFNNKFNGREAIELVFASIQLETMQLIKPEWIEMLSNLEPEDRDDLYDTFGIEPEQPTHSPSSKFNY